MLQKELHTPETNEKKKKELHPHLKQMKKTKTKLLQRNRRYKKNKIEDLEPENRKIKMKNHKGWA